LHVFFEKSVHNVHPYLSPKLLIGIK